MKKTKGKSLSAGQLAGYGIFVLAILGAFFLTPMCVGPVGTKCENLVEVTKRNPVIGLSILISILVFLPIWYLLGKYFEKNGKPGWWIYGPSSRWTLYIFLFVMVAIAIVLATR